MIGNSVVVQTEVIETRVYRNSLGEDGIIYNIIFLHNAEVNKADIAANISAITKLAQGVRRPILSDIRNLKDVDREGRRLGAGKEAASNILALAILLGSPVSQAIGNIFLKINKPKYPTRLFTSESEAVLWLKRFLS